MFQCHTRTLSSELRQYPQSVPAWLLRWRAIQGHGVLYLRDPTAMKQQRMLCSIAHCPFTCAVVGLGGRGEFNILPYVPSLVLLSVTLGYEWNVCRFLSYTTPLGICSAKGRHLVCYLFTSVWSVFYQEEIPLHL